MNEEDMRKVYLFPCMIFVIIGKYRVFLTKVLTHISENDSKFINFWSFLPTKIKKKERKKPTELKDKHFILNTL